VHIHPDESQDGGNDECEYEVERKAAGGFAGRTFLVMGHWDPFMAMSAINARRASCVRRHSWFLLNCPA